MPRPHRLLPCLLTALLLAWQLAASPARAQLPSGAELVAALESTAAQARQQGMVWRSHLLWMEALRQRSPLVAAHHQGVCHLGYSAYAPGQDHRWLFPALPAPQRAAWLAGVVQHELAHCAEQAATGAAGQGPAASARQQEVLADLAFALHVDAHSDDGPGLISLLAALRSRHAAADPVHDTADALHCYLRQRGSFQPPGDWLARLRAWSAQCRTAPDAPIAPRAPPAQAFAAVW